MKIHKENAALVSYLKKVFLMHKRNIERANELNSLFLHAASLETLKQIQAVPLGLDDYCSDKYFSLVPDNLFKNKPYLSLYYEPYEPFLFAESECKENNYYEIVSHVGYFQETYHYPALLDESTNTIWMSVIPHEINTMKKPILSAKGKCLVLGAGMLYYALHIATKDSVEKVVVIDNNPKILDLAKKMIVHSPFHKKINFIQEDAIKATKELNYDFLFADLWHMAEDALPLYFPLKRLEEKKTATCAYWIEEEIIITIRECLLTLVEESFYELELQEPNLYADKKGQPHTVAVLNALARYFKNQEIHNISDFKKIASKEFLVRLIGQIQPIFSK